MTELIEYLKLDNCIIVGIADEDKKLLGFTIADNNMQRACESKFESAYLAMAWADDNFKELI